MITVAVGNVHPVSGGWHLERPVEVDFSGEKWLISIHQSQVHVVVDGPEPTDVETFRNDIRNVAQGCVDALGYHLAVPLRVELSSMILGGIRIALIEPGWSALRDEDTDRGLVVLEEKLSPFTIGSLTTPSVRLALADLRDAIDRPDDTAFYCYRAVESVRQWFLGESSDHGAAKEESWEKMRGELGIGRKSLMPLKELADSRRHGGSRTPSEEERLEALRIARLLVARFIEYVASSEEHVQARHPT